MLREQRRPRSKITELGRHVEIICRDRLAGHLTVEEYATCRNKVKAEIDEYEHRLAIRSVDNSEYQSQGAELLRVLCIFPDIYATQDYAGRAQLLKAIVQRVTLRAGKAEVIFQSPFDSLAEAGTLLYNEQKWGE